MTKRREKQSENLEIRLGHNAKQAFMEACRDRGLTASEVVREFVEAYPRKQPKQSWSIPKPKLPEPAMNLSAVVLLSAALGTSAIIPTAATADRQDPERSFAEIDTDRDGYFTLEDLHHAAGLRADGTFGPEFRAEVVASLHEAIDDLGMLAQSAVLDPAFIDRTLEQAQDGAVRGVEAAFLDVDANGDGRVSRAEYLDHWENGSRQFGPSDPDGLGPDFDPDY